MEQARNRDWVLSRVAVQEPSKGLRRRGQTHVVEWRDVTAELAAREQELKLAAENSTAGRIRRREPLPNNGSRLIGSYATIARLLDEMAEIDGLAGVMLTFDDFIIGIEQFGQRIQPLMKSRMKFAAAAS